MRAPALPIIASFALLAAPAFAQSSATPGPTNPATGAETTGTTNPATGAETTGTTNPTTGAETTGNTTGGSTMGQTGVPGPSSAWDHSSAAAQSGASNPSTAWHRSAAMGQSGMSGPSTGWQQNAGVTTDTEQKIEQSLDQSGFKDVRVRPQAFVIHAQAPDGSHVIMVLRPDSVTGIVEQTGSSTAPNGATSSGSPNSESGASH